MPAPSTVPTWATDATFTSGPKSGSPTKITPSSGAQAQGEVPGDSYRAERHNWLFNLVCGWLAWLATINTQSDFLNRTFAWVAQHTFSVAPITPGPTKNPGTGYLVEEYLNLATAVVDGTFWAYSTSNGHLVAGSSGGAQAHIPIAVSSSQELKNIRVRMRVGGGTATLALIRFTADESGFSAPTRTVIASVTQAATTGAEVTLGADITHTLVRLRSTGSGWYVLSITSGSSTDVVYSACLKYNKVYSGDGGVSV